MVSTPPNRSRAAARMVVPADRVTLIKSILWHSWRRHAREGITYFSFGAKPCIGGAPATGQGAVTLDGRGISNRKSTLMPVRIWQRSGASGIELGNLIARQVPA